MLAASEWPLLGATQANEAKNRINYFSQAPSIINMAPGARPTAKTYKVG